MTDKDGKIVSLADYKDQDDEERKKFFLEQLEQVRKAIENDELSNFLLEWEKEKRDGEDTMVEGAFLFWNELNSIDVAIARCERIKTRLVLVSEGMIGPE